MKISFLYKLFFFISIYCFAISIIPIWLGIIVDALMIAYLIYAYFKVDYKLQDRHGLYVTKSFYIILSLYILWVFFNILRGVSCLSLGYFYMRALLTNSLCALTILFIPYLSNISRLEKFIKSWFSVVFLFCVFICCFAEYRLWSTLLTPLILLIFFSGSKSVMYQFYLALFCLLLCFIDLEARSPLIKFGVAIVCLLPLNIKCLRNLNLLRLIHVLCYMLPLIFFYLALSDIFNIFQIQEEVSDDYIVHSTTTGESVNALADTRTFIYVEVLQSAVNNDYIWFGRSLGRGNDSLYALDLYDTGIEERFMNECSMLNIFTWMGVIGCVLYSLIFIISSSYAINKSKNKYVKVMGVYISFIWCFSWIEIINIVEMSYITFLLMIIICASKKLCAMTDKQFEEWSSMFFGKSH